MLVGQDEAAFAWMDEGFTSFHEDEARNDFYPGADAHEETREAYLRVAGKDVEVPLMRHTDLVSPYGARTVAAYSKPATMLVALRGILGDELFLSAMRTYAREWTFRHPQPWDWFNTVERVAGRDLDWFWYPWWWETGTLDFAVAAVEPQGNGVRVTVRDLGEIPAPAELVVTYADGSTVGIEIPVHVWTEDRTRTATTTLPAPAAVVRVEVDPRRLLPDVDRTNNAWSTPGTAAALAPGR
jgi:aminopeptidase N